jgi:hypothetical protein
MTKLRNAYKSEQRDGGYSAKTQILLGQKYRISIEGSVFGKDSQKKEGSLEKGDSKKSSGNSQRNL